MDSNVPYMSNDIMAMIIFVAILALMGIAFIYFAIIKPIKEEKAASKYFKEKFAAEEKESKEEQKLFEERKATFSQNRIVKNWIKEYSDYVFSDIEKAVEFYQEKTWIEVIGLQWHFGVEEDSTSLSLMGSMDYGYKYDEKFNYKKHCEKYYEHEGLAQLPDETSQDALHACIVEGIFSNVSQRINENNLCPKGFELCPVKEHRAWPRFIFVSGNATYIKPQSW